MDDPKCQDCQHFRQHYVLFTETRYDKVPCGHCVHPRLKHRKPDTLACVYFKQREDAHTGRDSFHCGVDSVEPESSECPPDIRI